MKFLLSVLPVGCVLVLFALAGCNSNRIAVTNSGVDVVRVKVEGSETKNMLGPSGTGYYNLDSRIQIGDAAIKFGRQVEIENTGSGLIGIVYNDTTGSERTLLLGESGTGYLGKSTLFKIGDVSVGVVKMQ